MSQELVRFGVAMEPRLLEELDRLAEARGSSRSELLRDLARAEVARTLTQKRVPAVAAVTLVYDHHVRELTEKLTEIQHDLGDQVRATLHVHLDHDHCLEVVVMRGRADEINGAADRLVGTRGVVQGDAVIIAESTLHGMGPRRADHAHPRAHPHEHPHPPAKRTRR
ncbi:MAG TPA: nickel-responsive transcriptional regulator NikR [Polyangiaceae bacterium]